MLNYRIVFQILGRLVILEGFFMLFSVLFSVIYADGETLSLALASMITLVGGAAMFLAFRDAPKELSKREGFLVVSLSWIFFSFFGTLPFILTGSITNLTDAFFETMSGFTTTGASILDDIESLGQGVLLWRSLTQWLGGMGIIVLSLAIMPVFGIGGIQLFVAEVPGPTPDKLHPRIGGTAKRLWGIYVLFTVSEMILLLIGGMSPFDSINHSLTTMATGGYSTRQASIAAFDSPFIQYTITLFMILAGTNFSMAYFGLKGRFRKVFSNEEFRVYIGFLFGFTLLFTLVLMFNQQGPLEQNFRESIFQVVSIMTTTGYATVDYLGWVPILVVLLFIIMFFGGSAGSTGGGIKIIRVWLIIKNSYMELKRMLHPNAVIPVRYKKRAVPEQITSTIINFVTLYMMIFIFGVVVMSIVGLDLSSAMGSVIASLSNIGPGIGSVGPAFTYSHIPEVGKWFLSFLMLIGRLELFTVLVLLSPLFWKK